MARIKRNISSPKRYAIIGDGYTEKIYFEHLKEDTSRNDFTIKPELPSNKGKGGNHNKVLSRARELLKKGYDHVYCIIDYDTVLTEKKEQEFISACKKFDNNDVTIYINNPCIEYWFLLHFKKSGREYTATEVENDLRNHITDYSKNQEYQKKNSIYTKLKPRLESIAIPNAKFFEINRSSHSNKYPRAEVYKLLEILLLKP